MIRRETLATWRSLSLTHLPLYSPNLLSLPHTSLLINNYVCGGVVLQVILYILCLGSMTHGISPFSLISLAAFWQLHLTCIFDVFLLTTIYLDWIDLPLTISIIVKIVMDDLQGLYYY